MLFNYSSTYQGVPVSAYVDQLVGLHKLQEEDLELLQL